MKEVMSLLVSTGCRTTCRARSVDRRHKRESDEFTHDGQGIYRHVKHVFIFLGQSWSGRDTGRTPTPGSEVPSLQKGLTRWGSSTVKV